MMYALPRFALSALPALAMLGLGANAIGAENLKLVHFTTTVGSFKIQGPDKPADGTLDITFQGTALVSGADAGQVAASGNLRLEISNPSFKKLVFHGQGRLVIKGKFNVFQFFGSHLSGSFTGLGIFHLYGEFDKNLETGYYWYDGGEKKDWGTGGAQMTVPGQVFKPYVAPKPTIRIQGKKG